MGLFVQFQEKKLVCERERERENERERKIRTSLLLKVFTCSFRRRNRCASV